MGYQEWSVSYHPPRFFYLIPSRNILFYPAVLVFFLLRLREFDDFLSPSISYSFFPSFLPCYRSMSILSSITINISPPPPHSIQSSTNVKWPAKDTVRSNCSDLHCAVYSTSTQYFSYFPLSTQTWLSQCSVFFLSVWPRVWRASCDVNWAF